MRALRVMVDLDTRPSRELVATLLEEIAENIRQGQWEGVRSESWWNVREVNDRGGES